MNNEIEKQLVSSEQRRKFTNDLKQELKCLVGRRINPKSKKEFSEIVKDTMKKNEVIIMYEVPKRRN